MSRGGVVFRALSKGDFGLLSLTTSPTALVLSCLGQCWSQG